MVHIIRARFGLFASTQMDLVLTHSHASTIISFVGRFILSWCPFGSILGEQDGLNWFQLGSKDVLFYVRGDTWRPSLWCSVDPIGKPP